MLNKRKIACKVGRLPKGVCGLAEHDTQTITVDLNQCDNVGSVILHELCHLENPEWSETKVLAYEKREWKKMSQLNKWQLLSWFFGKAYLKGGGDEED